MIRARSGGNGGRSGRKWNFARDVSVTIGARSEFHRGIHPARRKRQGGRVPRVSRKRKQPRDNPGAARAFREIAAFREPTMRDYKIPA